MARLHQNANVIFNDNKMHLQNEYPSTLIHLFICPNNVMQSMGFTINSITLLLPLKPPESNRVIQFGNRIGDVGDCYGVIFLRVML